MSAWRKSGERWTSLIVAEPTRGSDSSKVVGRRIEDIRLPQGTTLGAVVRGEDVIIAHHDTTVQPDDHLILFLTDRRHIDAVEKLFQGSASFL